MPSTFFLPVTLTVNAGQKSSRTTNLKGRLVGVLSSHRDSDPPFSVDFAVGSYHITFKPVDIKAFTLTADGGIKVPCMFHAPLPYTDKPLSVTAYNTGTASGTCNLTFLVER